MDRLNLPHAASLCRLPWSEDDGFAVEFADRGQARSLAVPGGEHEALGPVLAELGDLVLLQDAEGLGGVIRAHHVFGVEDVAEVVAREPVSPGVPGVEFGA